MYVDGKISVSRLLRHHGYMFTFLKTLASSEKCQHIRPTDIIYILLYSITMLQFRVLPTVRVVIKS